MAKLGQKKDSDRRSVGRQDGEKENRMRVSWWVGGEMMNDSSVLRQINQVKNVDCFKGPSKSWVRRSDAGRCSNRKRKRKRLVAMIEVTQHPV